MVTLQELDKREEELKSVESKARNIQKTKIPERKFGAGVTREAQQQAYAKRAEGKRVLGEVEVQRKELKSLRNEVIVYNKRQEEIRKLEEKQAYYQQGRDIALNKPNAVIALAFLPPEARQGYLDAKAEMKASTAKSDYLRQISDLKAQGLKPIYDGGKLVGFEDEVRKQSISIKSIPSLPESDLKRYEKGGVVELEKPGNLPPNTIVQNEYGGYSPTNALGNIVPMSVNPPINQSMEEPKRYEPFFGRVEKVIKYPFDKLADLNQLYQEKVFPEYEVGFGVIEKRNMSYLNPPESTGSKGFRFVGELVAYPVYGAKKIEQYIFDPVSREEFSNLSLGQKGLEVLNIGLSAYTAGSLGKAAFKRLTTPITIKETNLVPEKYFADTKVYSIRQGGRVINVAEFEVVGVSSPIKAYQIPKWAAKLRGFKANDVRLEKYSLEQLKLIAPEGKIVDLKPLTVTRSFTEPFIVQNGKIITATGGLRKPGVFSYRTTYYSSGKTRITSKDISFLSGRTYPEQRLGSLSKSRSELPKTTQKGLEELEKLPAPEGFKAKKVYDAAKGLGELEKGPKFSQGDLELKKLLKLTNKEAKVVPQGRRTTRADVTTIQDPLAKIDFADKGALKRLEILKEDIAAIDTTFPRFNKPKKAVKIEGKTKVYEIDLNPEENLGNIGSKIAKKGGKDDINLQDTKIIEDVLSKSPIEKLNQKENAKIINEAIGNVGLKQSNLKVSTGKVKAPEVKADFKTPTASAFAGTGTYERTEGGALPGMKLAPEFSIKSAERLNLNLKNNIALKINSDSRTRSRFDSRTEQKLDGSLLTKSDVLLKNVPKVETMIKTQPKYKTQVKTIPKSIPKSLNKSVIPSPRTPKGINYKMPKSKSKKIPKLKLPSGNLGSSNLEGEFKVFGKRRGKFKQIGIRTTEKEARKLFLKFQKGSLGRSAYVEKDGKRLTLKQLKLGKEFRFSKKSPTVIVQKSKFSLGTSAEVREIQSARNIKI